MKNTFSVLVLTLFLFSQVSHAFPNTIDNSLRKIVQLSVIDCNTIKADVSMLDIENNSYELVLEKMIKQGIWQQVSQMNINFPSKEISLLDEGTYRVKVLQRIYSKSVVWNDQINISNEIKIDCSANAFTSIYPNPSSGIITFDNSKEFTSIKILNNNAITVYSETIEAVGNPTINLEHLPSGFYHILLQNSHSNSQGKFEIIK